MSILEREAYVLSIMSDADGQRGVLGNDVNIVTGKRLLGQAPKNNEVRITLGFGGGSYQDDGYTDRHNMYNWDVIIHSKNRTRLFECLEVLLDRFDNYQLAYSIEEELYSESNVYMVTISV